MDVTPHYEFVEITRKILENIVFKNTFYEKRDKKGAVQFDKNGNLKLKDARCDFSHAIRSLRNTGFVEGSSLENVDAHFIVLKTEKMERQNGGQNKQSLWVRKDAFEKWTRFHEITGTSSKNIQNGIVYFIHMEDNLKMFKIGYTTDLNKRLESLQIGNPHLLCTYRTIEKWKHVCIVSSMKRKLEVNGSRLHQI